MTIDGNVLNPFISPHFGVFPESRLTACQRLVITNKSITNKVSIKFTFVSTPSKVLINERDEYQFTNVNIYI